MPNRDPHLQIPPESRLRFCQERLRAQSPTPPLLKPKRLKGVGLYASEREREQICPNLDRLSETKAGKEGFDHNIDEMVGNIFSAKYMGIVMDCGIFESWLIDGFIHGIYGFVGGFTTFHSSFPPSIARWWDSKDYFWHILTRVWQNHPAHWLRTKVILIPCLQKKIGSKLPKWRHYWSYQDTFPVVCAILLGSRTPQLASETSPSLTACLPGVISNRKKIQQSWAWLVTSNPYPSIYLTIKFCN